MLYHIAIQLKVNSNLGNINVLPHVFCHFLLSTSTHMFSIIEEAPSVLSYFIIKPHSKDH